VHRGLALVVAVAACRAAPSPPPTTRPPDPARARVEIAAAGCGDAQEAIGRIRFVLQGHNAAYSDLVIRVDGGATELRLRIAHASGEVGLDRAFTLAAGDCASAPQLLALSVDRFLTAFPEWAGPPPPPPPPAPPPTRWLDVTLRGAVSSIWVPLGVDAHAGGLVDLGGDTHRFGIAALVRASVPQAAGSGRFQQTAFLAGATYRYRAGAWRFGGELRAGALVVSGIGYALNASDWLPWWEGAVFAGRPFRWGAIGVEVAASGLRDKAVTRDGLVEEDIPALRVGLAGELGVASTR